MKRILIYVMLAVVFLLSGCKSDTVSAPDQGISLPDTALKPNEEDYLEVVIPQNMFGGKNKTAEDIKNGFDSMDAEQRAAVNTDVIVNPDGTATLILTPEQCETCKNNLLVNKEWFGQETLGAALTEVKYEDESLSQIMLYVKEPEYSNAGAARSMASMALAVNAGNYQVLCGVGADEWKVVITVINHESGEVISQTEYPNDTMYDAQ